METVDRRSMSLYRLTFYQILDLLCVDVTSRTLYHTRNRRIPTLSIRDSGHSHIEYSGMLTNYALNFGRIDLKSCRHWTTGTSKMMAEFIFNENKNGVTEIKSESLRRGGMAVYLMSIPSRHTSRCQGEAIDVTYQNKAGTYRFIAKKGTVQYTC